MTLIHVEYTREEAKRVLAHALRADARHFGGDFGGVDGPKSFMTYALEGFADELEGKNPKTVWLEKPQYRKIAEEYCYATGLANRRPSIEDQFTDEELVMILTKADTALLRTAEGQIEKERKRLHPDDWLLLRKMEMTKSQVLERLANAEEDEKE
jgi:hypothetical protein